MTVDDLVRTGLHEGSETEPASRLWLAAAGMALFALLWAAVERLGARAGVPATQVVWMRYGTQLLLLSTLFGHRAGSGLVRTHELSLHVVRSLLMLGMPLSFIVSLKYLSVREVEAVFWVGIAVFGAARTIQVRGAEVWFCILSPVLALAGAWQILQPYQLRMRPAIVFPLATAGFFLLYQIMTRAMTGESELSKLFHTALWVFASLSFVVPFGWHAPSRVGWVAAIGIGVLGCAALFALDIALRWASPFRLASVSFLQPLFALGGAALLDGGRVSAQLLGGGACIILGALMALMPGKLFRAGVS